MITVHELVSIVTLLMVFVLAIRMRLLAQRVRKCCKGDEEEEEAARIDMKLDLPAKKN